MGNKSCFDVGSASCPCALGKWGKCPVCGKVGRNEGRTSECELCSWQGCCVYTLYEQNGRQTASVRQTLSCRIEEVKHYLPEFKVFVIKADKGFCQKASAVGSSVFVRPQECENHYDMPITVLKSEPGKGLLHLAVCGCGPKSREVLALQRGDLLSVRGIYRNALTGLENISKNAGQTVIYGKGSAVASLRNLLDDPLLGLFGESKGKVQLYMDLDKITFDFFEEYFGDFPVERIQITDFAKDGLTVIHKEVDNANIIALTSPYYADCIEEITGKKIVRPVLGNLCCGEGVCGACSLDMGKGETVHRCKNTAVKNDEEMYIKKNK